MLQLHSIQVRIIHSLEKVINLQKSLITSFELVWEIALTGKVKFLSIHCTLAEVNVKEQEPTNGV